MNGKRNDLSQKIVDCAAQCGFDHCGIVALDGEISEQYEHFLEKRIEELPDSRPFYSRFSGTANAKERFPWARAVVVLVFDYGKFQCPEPLQGRYGKAFFLDPLKSSGMAADTRRFEEALAGMGIRAEQANTLPLRLLAARAGLGIIRKNNFFYTQNGSFNNLMAYAIDACCVHFEQNQIRPCSPTCTLCQKACPTGALCGPYAMNPLQCVSFLTTFGNCKVPKDLSPDALKEWVCGCDSCQDACPYNRAHDWSQGIALPGLEDLASAIEPAHFTEIDDQYLIEELIPRTADHLQPDDVQALRINAARSAAYAKRKAERKSACDSPVAFGLPVAGEGDEI